MFIFGLIYIYNHVCIHSLAYLWLIFFQWIGQTPSAGPPGSWSSQITEGGSGDGRNIVACGRGLVRLIKLFWLIFLQIRQWNIVFSDSASTKYWWVLSSFLITASGTSFQGKNATIIQLLSLFCVTYSQCSIKQLDMHLECWPAQPILLWLFSHDWSDCWKRSLFDCQHVASYM